MSQRHPVRKVFLDWPGNSTLRKVCQGQSIVDSDVVGFRVIPDLLGKGFPALDTDRSTVTDEGRRDVPEEEPRRTRRRTVPPTREVSFGGCTRPALRAQKTLSRNLQGNIV